MISNSLFYLFLDSLIKYRNVFVLQTEFQVPPPPFKSNTYAYQIFLYGSFFGYFTQMISILSQTSNDLDTQKKRSKFISDKTNFLTASYPLTFPGHNILLQDVFQLILDSSVWILLYYFQKHFLLILKIQVLTLMLIKVMQKNPQRGI